MATLGNILARKGGTAMTGLEVTLTLAIPQAGAPLVEEAKVLLLPVSETRKARAFREAEAYVVAEEEAAAKAEVVCTAPTAVDERAFRFLIEAMRDPEDARKFFVEAKNIDQFRDILIAEQKRFLIESYDELIKREYAELRADEVKEQAKQLFFERPALALKVLACDVKEWFRVRSIHSIHDADAVRFELVRRAAFEFLNPPKRRTDD